MNQILVLGASGFVGKNFLESCKNFPNIKFVCVSRLKDRDTRIEKNIEWIDGDLFEKSFLRTIFNYEWDQIFNFFWSGLPARDIVNNEVNYRQTIQIFDYVKKTNNFINTLGSGLEFAISNHSISDDSNNYSADNFALTKQRLHRYLVEQDIGHRWIRPFYIYGKWQNSKSLLASIFQVHAKGNKFQSSNGQIAHDFTAVDDFIEVLCKFIPGTKKSAIYNVGSGELISVENFAIAAQAALNGEKFVKLGHAKITNGIYSSNSNLKKEYNWRPTYKGAEGVYSYVLKNVKDLEKCFLTQ